MTAGRVLSAVLAARSLLVGSTALPAVAVPPEPFFEEFEDSFTDTESCDFPIEVSFVGTIQGLEFFDRDGNLVRVQAKGKDIGTVTNPANGKTAQGVDNWLEGLRCREW